MKRPALPIRTLLIGFGDMGRDHHVPALQELPQTELVGIVRSRPREAVPGIPVFTSLVEALERLRPRLAIVATPHHLHSEQARLCLEHDSHVLVEKPLSLDLDEAVNLVKLAEQRRLLLVEGLQRRYEGFAQVFRDLTQSGDLGELLLLHGLFAHRFGDGDRAGWRSVPSQAGDGILSDSAVHLIDLLVYFGGIGIHHLRAQVLGGGQEGSHSFLCFFSTDRGASISACGSYLSPRNSVQEEISLWGTKGALFARRFCPERNLLPPRVTFKDLEGTDLREFDLQRYASGRGLPLKTLVRVLAGATPRGSILSEARHTLGTHRVLAQIRQSVRVGESGISMTAPVSL